MKYMDYDAETLFSVGRRFLHGDCVEKEKPHDIKGNRGDEWGSRDGIMERS